jgi:hypothetical protein
MADTVSGFAGQVIGWFANLVLSASEWFRVIAENWGTATELMKQTAVVLIMGLRDLFFNWPSIVAFALGRMIKAFVDAFNFVVKVVSIAVSRIGTMISNFVTWAVKKIASIFTGENIAENFDSAIEVISQQAKNIPKAFRAGFKGESFFDEAFVKSKALEDAISKQQALFDKLKGKKKELEDSRDKDIKDLTAKDEKAKKQKDKPTKVEKMEVKQVEFPRGFVGLTDLAKQIQDSFLKQKDPQKKMVGLLTADQGIQRKQAKALEQIAENTKGQAAVADE